MQDKLTRCTPAYDLRIAGEILEASPSVAVRLTGGNGQWNTVFVTHNIRKFGYEPEDFLSQRLHWENLVHPDDLQPLIDFMEENLARKNDRYNCVYRLLCRDGTAIWVSDDTTIHRDADGRPVFCDCIVADYTETKRHIDMIEDFYQQQRIMKEILQGLHDSDPEKAVQIILDSTGVYLDISRVLLFQDSPDHRTCRVIHEWRNTGIDSAGNLFLDYDKDIPEIRDKLREDGQHIINYGEIPPLSENEFDNEGVIAAAIFAVIINNERFGFICFDECVKKRFWPQDTVRFLRNIANLAAPAIIRKESDTTLRQTKRFETPVR